MVFKKNNNEKNIYIRNNNSTLKSLYFYVNDQIEFCFNLYKLIS
jgi:hypothetical protein